MVRPWLWNEVEASTQSAWRFPPPRGWKAVSAYNYERTVGRVRAVVHVSPQIDVVKTITRASHVRNRVVNATVESVGWHPKVGPRALIIIRQEGYRRWAETYDSEPFPDIVCDDPATDYNLWLGDQDAWCNGVRALRAGPEGAPLWSIPSTMTDKGPIRTPMVFLAGPDAEHGAAETAYMIYSKEIAMGSHNHGLAD